MLDITLRFLKDKWKSILVYVIAGIGFMWMYVGMFPSIQKQAGNYADIAKAFPEAMLKAFGIQNFSISHLENFLSIEHFSLIWPLMLILLVTAFAANAIAAEVEKGTIELTLARPVSRLSVFWGKYLAGIIALLVFVALSIFSIAPLAGIHQVSYTFSHFVTMAVLGALFGWAIFSCGMMFSAFVSDKSKVGMYIGAVLIVMYVLNIISGLKESFQNLQYFSLFHYFTSEAALVNNNLPTNSVLVFVGVAIVCTLLAAWRFAKRDIAT
ncbi:MAG: ABC transporter permease subunit [Patescibacteria group bacterium]|jgi:ABC-2 type transport system permease protein